MGFTGLGRRIGDCFNSNSFVRTAKNFRNALIDRSFRVCNRNKGKLLAEEIISKGWKNAAFTIAFNKPWLIALLIEAWHRHPCGFNLVVIDNSKKVSARGEIAEICKAKNIPYLALPSNPEWSPNRSHGIALNWTWFNVITLANLDNTGFIDHDCIPIRSFDILSKMKGLEVYGLKHISRKYPNLWNLWAGYCFFNYQIASKYLFDFKHRVEYGLDTGGGNWLGFYQHLDQSIRREALTGKDVIDLGSDLKPFECLLIDEAFIHLEGGSYSDKFRDDAFCNKLSSAIREKYI